MMTRSCGAVTKGIPSYMIHIIAIKGIIREIAMENGIVTKPSAWLYGKDRMSHVDELFMGWAVRILGEIRGILDIETHYGYRGYLKKEAVWRCTPEDLKRRDESGQTVFIGSAFADILEEPDVHSRILYTLNRGSFLTKLPEVQKGYQKVRLADGKEGFVPCIFLEYRKESDEYLYDEKPETYFLRQSKENMFSKTEFQKSLIVRAKNYLGTQYRWAGKSAEGIDCSGFAFMCYLMNGIIIYRDAKIKSGYPVHEIRIEQIEPGDLLYFPGHIAIYLGNLKYIHATGNEKSFGCVINSLSKKDADYRADLAESILKAGSIW